MDNHTHYHRNETPQDYCKNCNTLLNGGKSCPKCGNWQ